MSDRPTREALDLPALDDVLAARARVEPHLHRTPVLRSRTLSEMTGLDIRLKCENLQRTGSFKPRGGINRIATLDEDARRRGVITISAGNNAQGIAFAAARLGVAAVLVMPENAVASKVAATRDYGAEVVLHGNVNEAFARLEELRVERDLELLHPFDDSMLIAGHGTLALEIREQVPEVEAIVCGVGGGGLIGGLAAALPDSPIRLLGVEPEGAPTMTEALAAGEPVRLESVATIADGLAPPFVGHRNLALVRERGVPMTLVSDPEMTRAMVLLLERCKLLVEPSAAAPLAALLAGRLALEPGTCVVLVLSGGNVDVRRLGELVA